MVRIGIIIAILVVVSLGIAGRQQMFGAITATEIAQLQEAYYAKNGKYLQILEGARTADRSSVASKLGVTVDAKYRVHVFENKRGFVVEWEDSAGFHSVGFGADAEAHTYFNPLAVATST